MLQRSPNPPRQTPANEPAINLGPATTWLIGLCVLVHLIRQVLPDEQDIGLLETFAIVPVFYTQGSFELSLLWRPFTYMLLHDGWLHLGVNVATLAAFGTGIERALGGPRLVLFTVLCGLVAAAAHIAIYPDSADAVIGASGGISGLFGAMVIELSRRTGRGLVPMAALWIGTMVITGMVGIGNGAPIAWVAHVGGFLAGLGLYLPIARLGYRRN